MRRTKATVSLLTYHYVFIEILTKYNTSLCNNYMYILLIMFSCYKILLHIVMQNVGILQRLAGEISLCEFDV